MPTSYETFKSFHNPEFDQHIADATGYVASLTSRPELLVPISRIVVVDGYNQPAFIEELGLGPTDRDPGSAAYRTDRRRADYTKSHVIFMLNDEKQPKAVNDLHTKLYIAHEQGHALTLASGTDQPPFYREFVATIVEQLYLRNMLARGAVPTEAMNYILRPAYIQTDLAGVVFKAHGLARPKQILDRTHPGDDRLFRILDATFRRVNPTLPDFLKSIPRDDVYNFEATKMFVAGLQGHHFTGDWHTVTS